VVSSQALALHHWGNMFNIVQKTAETVTVSGFWDSP
jgi:hypothetical protein